MLQPEQRTSQRTVVQASPNLLLTLAVPLTHARALAFTLHV